MLFLLIEVLSLFAVMVYFIVQIPRKKDARSRHFPSLAQVFVWIGGALIGFLRRAFFLLKAQPQLFFGVLVMTVFPFIMTYMALLQAPPDRPKAIFVAVFFWIIFLITVSGLNVSISDKDLKIFEKRRLSWSHWAGEIFFSLLGLLPSLLIEAALGKSGRGDFKGKGGASGGGGAGGKW